MDDLPSDYDAIIVGTGMIESILAAAISRSGRSILHIDSNDYYGENWASFSVEAFENWCNNSNKTRTKPKPTQSFDNLLNNNETFIEIKENSNVWNTQLNQFPMTEKKFVDVIKDVKIYNEEEEKSNEKAEKEEEKEEKEEKAVKEANEKADEKADEKEKEKEEEKAVEKADEKANEKEEKKADENADEKPDEKPDENELKVINEMKLKLKKNFRSFSRKFNLDLCPKLLFSNGTLVKLLIKSNIARYTEFKSVNRVLTWREGKLEPVPCSRADVFATKNVTVVHKRILVKILTLFANYTENLEDFEAFHDKTFLEFLKSKKLPENLIHYILYAIAMGDDTTSCLDGVKNSKAFLESLGKFGNTPFIFTMYGSGELPQCFCRLSAVYGGVYCLQRGIEGLIIKENECVGIVSNNKRLNGKVVILSSKYAPESYLVQEDTQNISRGILITDGSILRDSKDTLTLLQFPPIPQLSNKSVTVIELGWGTSTCPEDYFIVHMTSKMTKNAYSDLKHVVEALYEYETGEKYPKPTILWSATWNVSRKSSQTSDSCVENVKICPTVDWELDYNLCVSEAKRIFEELYPDEEFLPRAPDPEEIILDMEETPGDDVTERKPESLEPYDKMPRAMHETDEEQACDRQKRKRNYPGRE